ncbi:MAG: acetate--CoA ligase family protein, partial [Spirochaetes bacterium]|nr:acetate--CoA ligase family protein [Spirochaetota bacterium]
EAIPLKVEAYIHSGRPVLTEYISKKVLTAYGIHCTREVLCKSAEETIYAAKDIGYPVALKVISPQIQHKTEAGIVHLNLGDEDAVKGAYEELLENARAYDSSALIDGVLCQQMIGGAVAEAIVGILMDPCFGPAVVFGLGGIMVEILQDRALGIPPLSRGEALEMIEKTRASKLLYGFRGSPRADLEALTDTLTSVGRLAVDWADRIEALDINPLMILPEGRGVIAVDALLVLKKDS